MKIFREKNYKELVLLNSNFLIKINTIVLLLIVIIAFIGCSNQKDEPLRVGTNKWLGYEPLYLARQLGYYDNQGVKLSEMPSSSDVIRAFEKGMIDCAALTLDETYLLMQDSIDMKILFIMDISNGGDALLAKPEIDNLSQLKGKKIGAENSALGAYVLCRALEFANLKPNEVTILPVNESSHERTFKSGTIDAIVTFEPMKSKLIEYGANILFDSKQIPNEIFDIFIVRSDIYEKRKEECLKLKEIWFKTLLYMNTNKENSIEFLAKRLGLTREQFIKSLDGIKYPNQSENLKILKNSFLKSAAKVAEIMWDEKLLKKRIDPIKLIIKD